MKLTDQVIIVTGSARAIGREYALRFSQEGARVVLCDILDCTETAKEIVASGGEVLSIQADITNEESILDMAQETVKRFGRIDVLVNNAALYADLARKPFYEISSDEWEKVMTVNLKGMFLCCKAVFPFMKKQGQGKIINIASSVAFTGGNYLAHYATSKGGVIALTRAIAREAGEYNINVNTVAPGFTTTSYNVDNATKGQQEKVVARRCLKREQLPEDLFGAVMFLASAGSNFITGQTIVVDGGAVFS
ncbi:SDR family NAD(P)-dependent oxidoreductase [Chloroflexota bacterium]